jgi:protein-disulfide isomerase
MIPLAFVAGLASGFLFWGRDGTSSGVAADPSIERFDVDADDDPFLGPEDAAVTIIEFGDYSCGYCQRFHNEILPVLLETYPDDVRFVYRDFPVVGGGTIGAAAAHAANCAGEQGAFWEYHDALFSGVYSMSTEGFDQYASDLGLDVTAFTECSQSGRYNEEIIGDFGAARMVGVTGTPTFFINGRKLIGAQPASAFAQIIESELND